MTTRRERRRAAPTPDYFDAVLVSIPLALALGVAAFRLAGAGWQAGVSAGAIVAMGVVGHALFVAAPRRRA
ncbi:MAG: hypothetical protein ABEJ68_04790 [Halobacteriaceae archaeon]